MVIVGSTTIDTNLIDDKEIIKIGGVTTYAGLTFKKLGIQTSIISNISLADNFIRDHFLKNDIEFFAGKSDYTTRFINKYESGVRTQNISSVASPIKKHQIKRINQVRLIYLGPLHANDIHQNLLKELSKLNSIITLDIQGLVRKQSNSHVTLEVSPILYDALDCADIVKAEKSEIECVLNQINVSLDVLMKKHNISEFIVTEGKDGGYILSRNGKIDYKACSVRKIVDPTGAGDVFFATYIASRIFRNYDFGASSKKAAHIASNHIGGHFIPFDSLRANNDILKIK